MNINMGDLIQKHNGRKSTFFVAIVLMVCLFTIPVNAAPPRDGMSDPIDMPWGGPTVHLDWAGQAYTSEEISFVGSRIFTPGDYVERTLQITNRGGADAVISVEAKANQKWTEVSANPNLGDGVFLGWSVGDIRDQCSFSDVIKQAGAVPLVQASVEAGATVELTVNAQMPDTVVDHSRQGIISTELDFTIVVRMQEDLHSHTTTSGLAKTGGGVLALTAIGVTFFLAGVASKRRAQKAQK